jgi:hypothetical protein
MPGVKAIHLRMQGGFCNRLRAIVSGVLWAEDLDCPLHIYWPVEPGHMACCLEELLVFSSIPRLKEAREGYLRNARQVLSFEDMKVVVGGFCFGDEVRIQSYSEFHPEVWSERGLAILRGIKIVHSLEEEAQAHWNLMGGDSDCIGVHFRGTDHSKCLRDSPLTSFFQKLDSLPSAKVFLATDEPGVKGEFIERYGKSRVATTVFDLGRHTKQQQKEGVIEWLLLQKCGQIFGSLGSSYSEIAALRAGCPYTAVTTDTKTTPTE